MNFILTDDIDSGKSSYVLALAERMIEEGLDVSGWITVAHMEGGYKIGHDMVKIERGRISATLPFTRPVPFKDSFPWRRFHFNSHAFEDAEKLAIDVDLFIMDELGPLELEESGGFIGIARRAIAGGADTLSVVRSGLDGKVAELAGEGTKSFSLAQTRELESALLAITTRS
jgi:nucleoside-triphosphatase THEP1